MNPTVTDDTIKREITIKTDWIEGVSTKEAAIVAADYLSSNGQLGWVLIHSSRKNYNEVVLYFVKSS